MIFQATCNSFKLELLQAIHDFSSDTFKIALYEEGATLDDDTTEYTATGEVTGIGYTAGGATLTVASTALSGVVAVADFEDITLGTVTLAARGALIYNASKANRAVAVLDFGRLVTKTAQDLIITFPAPDSVSGIIRIK